MENISTIAVLKDMFANAVACYFWVCFCILISLQGMNHTLLLLYMSGYFYWILNIMTLYLGVLDFVVLLKKMLNFILAGI